MFKFVKCAILPPKLKGIMFPMKLQALLSQII